MNHLDSLTTWEKIMNMAKLGTVSAAGNYFHSLGKRHKQRAGGLMRYTLCEYQGKAKRTHFCINPHSGIAIPHPETRHITITIKVKLLG